ncbi:Ras- protein rsr1 [Microbotryomycetes sp. JL201]|nr:Ras- protein rsr1 [Microbotryomycetes sp. JL201]
MTAETDADHPEYRARHRNLTLPPNLFAGESTRSSGSGGVGKSAITVRFVHSLFDPTVEDSYRRLVTVDNITVSLEIYDTAGTEQFMALHSMYMKSGDGFLLVFSLTNMESIAELKSASLRA